MKHEQIQSYTNIVKASANELKMSNINMFKETNEGIISIMKQKLLKIRRLYRNYYESLKEKTE